MRLALLVQRHSWNTVLDLFEQHPDFEGKPVCILTWGHIEQMEGIGPTFRGIPIVSLSRMDTVPFDAAFISVHNLKRTHDLVRRLHDAGVSTIHINRPKSVYTSADFITGKTFNPDCVDTVTAEDGRAYITYIEAHVTDQCNMNCKACLHFTPFAPPYVTDTVKFEESLQKFSRLFLISEFHIMGGEPLLYPGISLEMLRISRKYFPACHLEYWTNGSLIPQMKPEFWEEFRKLNVLVNMSIYPPVMELVPRIERILREHNLVYVLNYGFSFRKVGVLPTQKDLSLSFPEEAARMVRDSCMSSECMQIRDGMISRCTPVMYSHFMAPYVGMDPDKVKSKSILDLSLMSDGWDALRQLGAPCDTCCHCRPDRCVQIPWGRCKAGESPNPADWLIEPPEA